MLCLPDSVLLEIFQYLSPLELCQVSSVCRKFRKIASDKILWKDVNLTSHPLSVQQLKKIMRAHFPSLLRSLQVRGFVKQYIGKPRWKTETVSVSLLNELKECCPSIEILFLHENYFGDKLNASHLPQSISSLSLSRSHFSFCSKWFVDNVTFQNLRHINLSYCTALTDTSLAAVCKWSNQLESINLCGCYRITDEAVRNPMKSLKCLKTLNMQKTSITDLSLHVISRELTQLHKIEAGDNCRITDSGAELLCINLKKLKYLDLRKTQISEFTLRCIYERLKALQYLNIKSTLIEESQIQTFKSTLPECILVF